MISFKEYFEQWEKPKSKFLSKSEEYGSYEGIVHFDIGGVERWFENHKMEFEKYIKFINLPVGFLNNINVDEDYRGEGNGSELYYDFEEECYNNGVECIILESDTGESQRDGFNLDGWYLSLDYKIIGNEGGNHLMIKKLN